MIYLKRELIKHTHEWIMYQQSAVLYTRHHEASRHNFGREWQALYWDERGGIIFFGHKTMSMRQEVEDNGQKSKETVDML